MNSTMLCGQNLKKEFPTKMLIPKSVNVYTLAPSESTVAITEVVKFKDCNGCTQQAVIVKNIRPEVLTLTETVTVNECVDVQVEGKKDACKLLKQVFPGDSNVCSNVVSGNSDDEDCNVGCDDRRKDRRKTQKKSRPSSEKVKPSSEKNRGDEYDSPPRSKTSSSRSKVPLKKK